MNDQLSFFGYDVDGRLSSDGSRLVYFVECGNFVKIGFTTRDVRERMKEFETGNPQKFNLIGTLAVPSGTDDRYLHKRFEMFRHRKEWFRKTPALIQAIDGLLQQQAIAHAKTTAQVAKVDVSALRDGDEGLIAVVCPSCGEFEAAGVLKKVGDELPRPIWLYHKTCNTRFEVNFVR